MTFKKILYTSLSTLCEKLYQNYKYHQRKSIFRMNNLGQPLKKLNLKLL